MDDTPHRQAHEGPFISSVFRYAVRVRQNRRPDAHARVSFLIAMRDAEREKTAPVARSTARFFADSRMEGRAYDAPRGG
jgi:hypothetical protein